MTLTTFPRKLVVIITEAAIEQMIARDVLALGAHGYTICDVRGSGAHGTRGADWEADRNIRVEVICEAPVAEKIAAAMREKYTANYAMSLFIADIGVLRPDKF
jgi:nitrogen regulatory protein P-II 2